MKVFNLTENSNLYTSNVFLVLGEWNAIDDVNTLIDVGMDPAIFSKINHMNTGLGKRKIDQVILTHSHSDHIALLPSIIETYKPKVYANNNQIAGVNHILNDGDRIKIGDCVFEVYHITAHSSDSICLYCKDNGFLFAGDTNFPIHFDNEAMEIDNTIALNRLCRKKISRVFYGHGNIQDYTKRKFQVVIAPNATHFECK